jgi:hypothetical protein
LGSIFVKESKKNNTNTIKLLAAAKKMFEKEEIKRKTLKK